MMVIVFSLQYHRHPRESCCMMVIVFSLQYHRHPRESCCMMVTVFSLQYHHHCGESCCMLVIVFSLQYHCHPRESCCVMVVFCSFQGVPCCSPLPDQHVVGSRQRDLQQSSRRFGPCAQNRFSTRSVPVPHSMSLQLYGVWWLQKIASTECVLR